ncbi:MAG TPA: NAD(P)H-hydrate dehydratase [Chthoniobacteraceae bacterium]|jgi:NAD(P)H-hydrate epimerase
MIVSSAEMRALEERAFAEGVTADSLMEEAGARIAAAVQQFFPRAGHCIAFFGKGHNGGDALVAARLLKSNDWDVEIRAPFPEADWSELTAQKYAQFTSDVRGFASAKRHDAQADLVVLDGLLGTGAGGALREPITAACREINRLRREMNAHVFSLDLPTGLNGDTGEADPEAVTADFTLTIGFAKRGLLADSATRQVGRLAVLPLRELTARATGKADAQVTTAATLAPLLPRRAFEAHKGDFGRIGIIAGSRGLTGAAVLAAEACARAGGGLVSLYVTEEIHAIAAPATSPEVMVRPVASYLEVLEAGRDVLALGPGLGQSRSQEALELIRRAKQPMIIDADGLNLLASELDVLASTAGPRLLTPHPGEMARLDPEFKTRTRREAVEHFTARFPHPILLKGARTIIGQLGRPLSYNTTGSPGLSTGGMGDVLTGVCAALAGQQLHLYDAARAASWLCGRAAELAIFTGPESEETLTPPVLLEYLGRAFKELRALSY